MRNRMPGLRQRAACLISAALLFGQAMGSARATDIADVPMAVNNLVRPNIAFMIDNSGSMSNIVPDVPFDPNVTVTCTSPLGGEVGSPSAKTYNIRILSGVPKIRASGSTDNGFDWSASGACFAPALLYEARLLADVSCGSGCREPGNYLAAVYTGNYLNWYFGTGTLSGWTDRRPGTQTRMEIAKSAAKQVVDSLDRVRVGLFSYNGSDGGTLNEIIGDLDAAKKTTVKSKIDSLTPSGSTPLAETLADIGKYFVTGYTGSLTLHPGLPNEITRTVSQTFPHGFNNGSGVSSPPAPVQFFCQRNFAVLLTDGRPQLDRSENGNISDDLKDYDGDCSGSNASNCDTFDRKVSRIALYESNGSDYLDDVAQALKEMDLRPDLQPPAGSGLTKNNKNNVLTYTIGFADEQVKNDPLMQETATQGGGLFLKADNAAQLVSAFVQAADDILAKDGSAAAVAVANANVTSGDNASFASSYNSGTWTGDLIAYPINTTTGLPDINNPIWNTGCADPNAPVDPSDSSKGTKGCSAQVQLDGTAASARKIATSTDAAGSVGGRQFQPTSASTATKLSSAQQSLLNSTTTPPGTSDGAAVLSYLRGDRSQENVNYRGRAHVLGDVVNSEPVVQREPFFSYVDPGYSTFKTNMASRTRVVYQGANDGMLHAFNAGTGAELWGYVPNLVMPNLNNLSRKSGFVHKYYVDGTPTVGDVDFSNTDGVTGNPPPAWRTVLVGGLNKGGRGYYAIDVTCPATAQSTSSGVTTCSGGLDEAGVASKVLWEFPNSITSGSTRTTVTPNVGYSFGRPVMVKTKAKGWVVLLTSGYNNGTGADNSGGDGQGYLFVVNPTNGDLIAAISTGVGTTADPSGLAQISAFVDSSDTDNTVGFVYGGDLKGNVWRFDLSGNNVSQWGVTKLATLVDDSGNPQSVTTAPELGEVDTGGGAVKRFVYVGTGQYLGTSDVATTQTQTMYGLIDDKSATPLINPLRSSLQQQTLTGTGSTRTASGNAVDFATQKGWYVDLPQTGERANTDPALALGALVFTTNVPSSTECIPGGSSWFNVLDYKTGGFLLGSTVTWSSVSLGSSLASRVVLIKLPSGAVKALVRGSDAITKIKEVPSASSSSTKRVTWRELPE